MRRWIMRLWNALCIGLGFKESPKHFEGFVWHRERDTGKLPTVHPVLSSTERATFRRVALVPAIDCIPTGPVSREQTEKYKALPRWLKEQV